jgi:Pyridoxamine 5'-phosphate oxidase
MTGMGPVAELDARSGDDGAEPTPWPAVVRVLEEAELFWISTVRAGGRPHVTPLPAVWQDGALHFCTGAGEQKAVNLARNAGARSPPGTTGGRPGWMLWWKAARSAWSTRPACNAWRRRGGRSITGTGTSMSPTAHSEARAARRWFSRSHQPKCWRSPRATSLRLATDSDQHARGDLTPASTYAHREPRDSHLPS